MQSVTIFRILMASSLMTAMLCNSGWGQPYPVRPVRIVVGFSSGGPDVSARIMAQALTAQTGQAFVVDSRTGASGMIGANMVAKAPADGYTLLVASGTFALLPSTYKDVPFDVIKDFAPITQIGSFGGFLLVASPSLPVRNVQELIKFARASNSKITFGTSGVGTTTHLATVAFNAAANIDMLHVPYKASNLTLPALASGEIQFMFATPVLVVPLIKAGKVRALAYDFQTRSPSLPDVPTLAEAGGPVTGIEPGGMFMFAPARTPPATLARVEAEARRAVALPEVGERLMNIGLTPVGSSSEQFRHFYFNLAKRLTEAARMAGVEPE